MAFSEIPAKMIESAESFTETRLKVALELTKLAYQSNKSHPQEEEIYNTFFRYYKKIQQINPPPLDKLNFKKNSLIIAGVVASISIVGLALYYIFFVRLGFN